MFRLGAWHAPVAFAGRGAASSPARRVTPQVPDNHARARGPTFKVTLNASATRRLGLRLNILLESDSLKVADVARDSLVEEWNEQHGPEQRVREGLWIVSVNGERGTASNMFRAIHQLGKLEIVLSSSPPPAAKALAPRERTCRRRVGESRRFPVSLQAVGEEGAGIEAALIPEGLQIQRIAERGAVEEWNRRHPEEQICAGDRIVFVNGEHGSAEMAASLQQDRAWRMVIRRGPLVVRREVLPDCVVDALPTVPNSEIGWARGPPLAREERGWHGGVVGDRAAVGRDDAGTDRARFCTGNSVRHRRRPSARTPGVLPFRREPFRGNEPPEKGERVAEGEECECGICLASIDEPQESVQLPCKHVFHRDCVTNWLTKLSALCPFCRWAADHPAGPDTCAKRLSLAHLDDDEVDEIPVETPTSRIQHAGLRTVGARHLESI